MLSIYYKYLVMLLLFCYISLYQYIWLYENKDMYINLYTIKAINAPITQGFVWIFNFELYTMF